MADSTGIRTDARKSNITCGNIGAILENEIGMFAICSESESQGDPQASDYECGIWVPVQAEGRL